MDTPLYPEDMHRSHLNVFLEGARDAKRVGHEDLVKTLSPLARDSLEIARNVGYEKLYSEFSELFDSVGL